MNVHDSERLTGLLEDAGYAAVPADGEQADVVVFNTCAVRENADNRLYGNLGHLAPVKAKRPGMQIAVGGCLAQKDRDDDHRRRRRGSTSSSAPTTSGRCRRCSSGRGCRRRRRSRSSSRSRSSRRRCRPSASRRTPRGCRSRSAATTPARSASSRRCAARRRTAGPATILAEIEALVAEGVSEVTLLGQNVNAYGVEFGDRQAFSKLLRACGEIEGLERVRFTSPHPAEFTDDVIEAMAETPNVMPQLHMPLQSGSDRVLRAMRRSYRQEKYLGIIDRVRAAMPDAAITTDIIVGFPGETEEDFRRRSTSCGGRGSPARSRSSTPSGPARPPRPWPTRCRADVVKDRYERLVALVNDIAWEENKRLVGRRVELMVAEGEGRKDAATHRLSGRGPDNRLVHFVAGRSDRGVRPGDMVTVEVTYAAPHHLVADGPVLACGVPAPATPGRPAAPRAAGPAVGLGMPAVGVPAPLPEAPPPAADSLAHRAARPRRLPRARSASPRSAADAIEALGRASGGARAGLHLRQHRRAARGPRRASGSPAVQAKFVGQGRGGYCFEHTTLFAAAAAAARVRRRTPARPRRRSADGAHARTPSRS